MRVEIARLHKEIGATMIYVTHDQVEAMSLSDKIAVINQGELQQYGTPEEVYNSPANLFVANFIGSPGMNLVRARVVETAGRTAFDFGPAGQIGIAADGALRRSLHASGLSEVIVGIRPENARIVDVAGAGSALNLTLALTESIGARATLHFDLGDSGFKLVENKRFSAPAGTPLRIALPEAALIVFDPVSGNVIRQEG
jgi:multiple sugar transport system ATP-binding protein